MSLPYELVTFMRIKDAKAARSVYYHGRVLELGVNGIRMINIDGPEREKLENDVLFEEEVNRLKENEELLPVSFVELVQDPIINEMSLTVRSRDLKYSPATSDRDDGLYYLVGTTDLQFSTNMMRTDSSVLLWSFRVENFDGSMNLWFAALYESI